LDPILLTKDTKIVDLLTFYMGKNTPDRQVFIIDNLRIEKDLALEDPKLETEEVEAEVD
jgi:topoisomerase-4 subunit B